MTLCFLMCFLKYYLIYSNRNLNAQSDSILAKLFVGLFSLGAYVHACLTTVNLFMVLAFKLFSFILLFDLIMTLCIVESSSLFSTFRA